MSKQLFYGQLTSSPTNRFTNLRGDYTLGSDTITNVVATSGDVPWELMRVGQRIFNTGELSGYAEILSFDSLSAEITIDQNALQSSTQNFTQWWLPEDAYYIPSGSLVTPNGDVRVIDITGSNDSNYDGSTPIYAILGPAALSQVRQVGIYHKYAITDTVYVNNPTNQISVFITWDEKGSESDYGTLLDLSTNQTLPIVALSTTESLAPIFSNNASGLSLDPNSQFAGYQIEVQDFLDDLVSTDIYYTGSEVSNNNRNINFSGSGVRSNTYQAQKGISKYR
jgi:hypothetical protein